MKYWLELLQGKAYKVRAKISQANTFVVGLCALVLIALFLLALGGICNNDSQYKEALADGGFISDIIMTMMMGILRLIVVLKRSYLSLD